MGKELLVLRDVSKYYTSGQSVVMGTLIVNLDDSHTRLYDPFAFPNGDPERIVVARSDGGDMTQADFDALLAVWSLLRLPPARLASKYDM